MGFAEVQFPTDIAYGSAGGPEFMTDIITSLSGHEQRNSRWPQARARYNVAKGVQTPAQLQALLVFFRARKGRAQGFRFKDWTDYSATGEIIGTGDGIRTRFQLMKRYVSGGTQELRTITKPVVGSVNIYRNAVLQTSGVSIDHYSGMVTFATAPAHGTTIAADFEFDVPVRFDTDQLSASMDSYGSSSWLDIPLIEVRGDDAVAD